MSIVQAKCTNCGGNLEVDSAKDAAVCPYCKTPFIVAKAINNYSTYVTNNLKADQVVVNVAPESDFIIDRVRLIEYKGHDSSVTIPDYIREIADEAFINCSFINSIVIPKSVKKIGKDAFKGCNITSVKIGTSEKVLSEYDDGLNGLRYLEILPGVTKIADWSFSGFKSLSSVTIPDSVTSIGNNAFNGCSGLTSVTIPNSVTSIGESAFSGCTGLTSVTIPKNVTKIGSSFIDANNLKSIAVVSGNPAYYVSDNCLIEKGTGLLVVGSNNSIIPADGSVTSIGNNAFNGCAGLTSVTIPNSVTSIGNGAFCNCKGLTSVTIPNSVTSIGTWAFNGCTSLTSATIGNGVTSIGNGAFDGCSGLTSVTIGNSVTSIGDGAFNGCAGLTSVTIPNSVTSIGRLAFAHCDNLESISIPSGAICEDNAFQGCDKLLSGFQRAMKSAAKKYGRVVEKLSIAVFFLPVLLGVLFMISLFVNKGEMEASLPSNDYSLWFVLWFFGIAAFLAASITVAVKMVLKQRRWYTQKGEIIIKTLLIVLAAVAASIFVFNKLGLPF